MPYVITCGDEGVQINQGVRLGVLGSGFKLANFDQLISALKKVIKTQIKIAASQENAWIKDKLDLATWEQADASAQQHTEALADKHDLLYAGFLPFADPQDLKHNIKGHMVRPKNIHIATQIQFTLAGGEQTFHLGQNVISAEWVSLVDPKIAKKILDQQINFYQQLAGDNKLKFVFEEEGELGEALAKKNKKVLERLGFKAS